jgi:hypothetical protein
MISLISIEAQICPNPMGICLRVQDMLLVHANQLYLLMAVPRICPICAHVSYSRLTDLMVPILRSYQNGERYPSSTHTCGECNTDSQVELCGFGSVAVLVITRWMSDGPGLTPDKRRWTIHCEKGMFVRRALDPCDMTFSPRRCFENASRRSLEVLQSSNLDCLRDPRYGDLLCQTLVPTTA